MFLSPVSLPREAVTMAVAAVDTAIAVAKAAATTVVLAGHPTGATLTPVGPTIMTMVKYKILLVSAVRVLNHR